MTVAAAPEAMRRRGRWIETHFGPKAKKSPFSFVYSGRSSPGILAEWDCRRVTRRLDKFRTEVALTCTDPKTRLQVRCDMVRSTDLPAVEWVLHFRNAGEADSPILSDIQAMDTVFERQGPVEWLLHHFKGDSCTKDSFEPIETVLTPGTELRFSPSGGLPSSGQWPYYNLAWDGGGTMIAVGWPGQWASSFTRDNGTDLRVRAGQELTYFTLHPGEEVRSPLIALMFYEGDWLRSQNVWRRWMFLENFPKDHGKMVSPRLAAYCGNWFPGNVTNETGEITFMDRYLAEETKLDYWWIDAGWYLPCKGDWGPTGTWEVDRARYPGGLRAISDHARSRGLQTIVWFEPERVTAGTWLAENHPDWVLGGRDGGVLNLGNPEAWEWLVERIDCLIVSEGVDVYRQDCNIEPLNYWRANDAGNRQGVTEIRHVEGYLAYWDELRRRHPGMLIDSCASGGRRDDLESMRRAVPFLMSDYCTDPDGSQCHRYGFSLWLPYYRGSLDHIDAYDFHSCLAPLMLMAWEVTKKDLDYALGRQLVAQWRQVADDFFGDFYPLTAYSLADNVWMAFQFDQPETGSGLVQAFRRGNSPDSSMSLKLNGLDPDKSYTVADLHAGSCRRFSGRLLMEKGIAVHIDRKRGAAIMSYRRSRRRK
jgi:alpha-galactosidase